MTNLYDDKGINLSYDDSIYLEYTYSKLSGTFRYLSRYGMAMVYTKFKPQFCSDRAMFHIYGAASCVLQRPFPELPRVIPVHAEKIQKYTGAPVKLIPKPKKNTSSRQVVDLLLHKNVNARMISRVLRSDRQSSVFKTVAAFEIEGIIPSRRHANDLPATVLSLLRPASCGNCLQKKLSYTCHITLYYFV
jgi:hypothetical protein